MDSYIFNDADAEEKDKVLSHSDESGYLSESELVVDDSDWMTWHNILPEVSDQKVVSTWKPFVAD